MANGVKRYENCPVFLYTENGNNIGQTVITEHDRHNVSIVVPDTFSDITSGARLNVLIIYDGGASEYNGIARGISAGGREISLFNQRQRDSREATRHAVNLPALIEHQIIDLERRPLPAPLNVVIDNISTSGALIKSPVGLFARGTYLEILFQVSGSENLLFGEIVRLRQNVDNTWDYGYKFITH